MNTFMAGVGQKWSFNGQDASSSRGRATLLILDRLDDLLSPLMHEFTYQVCELNSDSDNLSGWWLWLCSLCLVPIPVYTLVYAFCTVSCTGCAPYC